MGSSSRPAFGDVKLVLETGGVRSVYTTDISPLNPSSPYTRVRCWWFISSPPEAHGGGAGGRFSCPQALCLALPPGASPLPPFVTSCLV